MALSSPPRETADRTLFTIGTWPSSRTVRETRSSPVLHSTDHRRGQSASSRRLAWPASTDTGTRSSSHLARCDQSGLPAVPSGARTALLPTLTLLMA